MTRWETKSICFNDIIYDFLGLDKYKQLFEIKLRIHSHSLQSLCQSYSAQKFCSFNWPDISTFENLCIPILWQSQQHINFIPTIPDPSSAHAGWHGGDMCWWRRSWWGVNITQRFKCKLYWGLFFNHIQHLQNYKDIYISSGLWWRLKWVV